MKAAKASSKSYVRFFAVCLLLTFGVLGLNLAAHVTGRCSDTLSSLLSLLFILRHDLTELPNLASKSPYSAGRPQSCVSLALAPE